MSETSRSDLAQVPSRFVVASMLLSAFAGCRPGAGASAPTPSGSLAVDDNVLATPDHETLAEAAPEDSMPTPSTSVEERAEPAAPACSIDGWCVLYQPPPDDSESLALRSMWGTSSDLFVTGWTSPKGMPQLASVRHWGGDRWCEDLPPGENFPKAAHIWGSDATNVFLAEGMWGGAIMHRGADGYRLLEHDRGRDVYWKGVWVPNATRAFFVGTTQDDRGVIVEYDGRDWNRTTVSKPVVGVWGRSATDIYAVAQYGAVWHYDGARWRNIRKPGANGWLVSVWSPDPEPDLVIGVTRGNTGKPTIRWREGRRWLPYPDAPYSEMTWVWGTARDDVFASGNEGIFHFDGSTWTQQEVPAGGRPIVTQIWGRAHDDVFAISQDHRLLHYAGPGNTGPSVRPMPATVAPCRTTAVPT